jgi:hypothetical protein
VSEASHPPEYADDDVMLRVEPPTASRATLRLHAAGIGVRAVIDLTLPAAGYLSSALRSVAVAAAVADLDTEGDPS